MYNNTTKNKTKPWKKEAVMKRSGFTMIELIFVIVILGILAAVAVPKLMATRTDAKISTIGNSLASAEQEIVNYYTSQGTLQPKGSQMSAVLKQYVDNQTDGVNPVENGDYKDTIQIDDGSGNFQDCVVFDWSNGSGAPGDYLRIYQAQNYTPGTNTICDGILHILGVDNGQEKNFTLKASNVKF
jgi:prepilin-type N-terminal cleavage/methylation domain-containing protein